MIARGEKVVLREKRLEDAEDDYRWRSDAELARYDATLPTTSPFEYFLKGYREELRWPSRWQRRFAIDTADGRHIGNCMYYDLDERKKQAELGILIGERDYWGRGYGADAITTLVEYIFDFTNLNRLYLRTLDWNVRAQKCFEKCGFVPCDKMEQGNKRFVVMELWRDWAKNRQNKASSEEEVTKKAPFTPACSTQG